jgi:hypothetical protein
MKQKRNWCWIVGKVSPDEKHIEIRFCNSAESGWNEWRPIARVAAPKRQIFTVEFLVAAEDPEVIEMVNAVKKELNYYLVDKREEDPWAYARYHCGTGANVYSNVHWSFFHEGANLEGVGKRSWRHP